MKKFEYKPEICEHCQQSTTYLLGIDHGTVNLVKKIAEAIGKKGINIIHPRKELEGVTLTSNDVGNLSRPRFHGLVASVKGETGNYLLTKKGTAFLRGMPIPKYAVISKSEGHLAGYYLPDEYVVTVHDFTGKGEPFWEGIGYDVEEGRVIKNI